MFWISQVSLTYSLVSVKSNACPWFKGSPKSHILTCTTLGDALGSRHLVDWSLWSKSTHFCHISFVFPSQYQNHSCGLAIVTNKYVPRAVKRDLTSPWSCGLILVEKEDGSQRFCIDFRRLNKSNSMSFCHCRKCRNRVKPRHCWALMAWAIALGLYLFTYCICERILSSGIV
jgi:hypothetical protein